MNRVTFLKDEILGIFERILTQYKQGLAVRAKRGQAFRPWGFTCSLVSLTIYFASRFDFSVGSQVLIRCDLNVPLDGKKITDDTRIRASVETIKYLVGKGARVAVSRPRFPCNLLARYMNVITGML